MITKAKIFCHIMIILLCLIVMCVSTYTYIFVTVARGWGDPHITTIDGRRYTFNGLGEYVLLRTSNSNFEFQGRTEKVPNSAATVFSAFALRDDDEVEVPNH